MIRPEQYYKNLVTLYQEAGCVERADKQQKYMRNQFAYYGLRSPEWMALLKTQFKDVGVYHGADLKEFVLNCYDDDHREINYSGILMIQKVQKKEDEDFIELLGYLITTRPWWDTVDWLSKLVGIHFKIYPELIGPITERWIDDDNMWLNRAAIIFQLFYKDQTDEKRLYDYILKHRDANEFFIQKAMGWALRQYSRTDSASVIKFVEANADLPKLTKKEARRLFKR